MSSIRDVVAKVLGVENSSQWEILDSDTDSGLHLIHYTESADRAKFGHLRGIIVDINAERIVCGSYGYTPTVIADQLTPGTMTLTDLDGTVHSIDTDTTKIRFGVEGAVLRVFFHRGKVYRSTHRRLNPVRSRWGNSKHFLDMYTDLGGPSDDQLFDLTKQCSPHSHYFLLGHPQLLIASLEPIGSGKLVYLGTKQLWTDGFDDVDWVVRPIPEPEFVSRDQANYHLSHGYGTAVNGVDGRLGPGEFIVLYHQGRVVKVSSTAHHFRTELRDNNPNLKHQFYKLLSRSHLDADTYKAEIPVVTPYDHRQLEVEIAGTPDRPDVPSKTIKTWKQWPAEKEWTETPADRTFNTWLCFLMSVPLSAQKSVVGFYSEMIESRKELADWLSTEPAEVMGRGVELIQLANPKDKYFKQNLHRLVSKERGDSLYKLLRAMKEIKNPRVKLVVE